MTRKFNFNAGPAALPTEVLEEAQKHLLDFHGEGLSILEMSHRSKTYDEVHHQAEALIKEVLEIPDNYRVLFFQGGATGQFAAVPLNLASQNVNVDYINTGAWSTKAIQEAEKLGKNVRVIASSEDAEFSYIPDNFTIHPDAAYVHITSNNTIRGTQWNSYPDTGDVPLVADMSSDIACRKIDVSKFGLIYAGAQKNFGPAGVTIVIIRNDLLERSPNNIPTVFNYKTWAGKDSLYNTPPVFAIYIVKLVAEWIKNSGGLARIEEINRKKADLLYQLIDDSEFYRGTARKDSRSIMNVTFRLPSEDLEKKFVAESMENGMIGLKGHRSVGGIRASIYNAVPLKAVESLVEFMRDFEKKNS
jgi:phosphoserine aminotransferase